MQAYFSEKKQSLPKVEESDLQQKVEQLQRELNALKLKEVEKQQEDFGESKNNN